MKNMTAAFEVRSLSARHVAIAAAAAAALTASLALVGHWNGSSFAAARPGVAMMAGGSVSPDGGPLPCLAPDTCNVG